MKLEEQVVSLDLAKKMKSLGFEQESLWYWYGRERKGSEIPFHLIGNKRTTYLGRALYFRPNDDDIVCSAYTVAELGEMLPEYVTGWISCQYGYLIWDKVKREKDTVHIIGYSERQDKSKMIHFEMAETEANARAKMLIYLKENNLL